MERYEPLKNKMKTMIGARPLPEFNFFYADEVKSAVRGLLNDIDKLIKWYEECRDRDYHIFTAKRDTAFRIKTKIKKWFPDVVEDENKRIVKID
ncbi:MAG: hypothetical protein DRH24_16280 [Deltaproteobacteria bacterium]|nr:MAG: hypothetical protein DRH24_16280 [Deltaproteobacteria bacterium]